ncbi:MAG: hypothetical protein ACREGC_00370 [Minisyncoccia bacterium]
MNDFPANNTGLITQTIPDGFLQGILVYKVVLPSGDWRPFCPPFEVQHSNIVDVQGCVGFSNNNTAEISLKQQGIDVNFSDRFLVVASGTNPIATNTKPAGNTFDMVEATCKIVGRVLESVYPPPPNYTLDQYYAPIPPEIFKQAVFYHEATEYVGTDIPTLKYHLKQCPIQIAIPAPHPNHAAVLVYIDDANVLYYFDSEGTPATAIKTMTTLPEAAMKLIIKPVTMTERFIVQDNNFTPAKVGVMVLEGFTGTITFADNPPHLQNLKDALGFTGTEQTIQLPQIPQS